MSVLESSYCQVPCVLWSMCRCIPNTTYMLGDAVPGLRQIRILVDIDPIISSWLGQAPSFFCAVAYLPWRLRDRRVIVWYRDAAKSLSDKYRY